MAQDKRPEEDARPPVPPPFGSRSPAAIPYRRPPATGAAGPAPVGATGTAPADPVRTATPPDRAGHAARPAARPVLMLALLLTVVTAGGSVILVRSGEVRHWSAGASRPSPPAASPAGPANRPPPRSGTRQPSSPPARRTAAPPPPARSSAPPAAGSAVTLRVRGNARVLRVRATNLGSLLVRVVRLDHGRARARLVDGRTADLQLSPERGSAPTVEVLVDASVRWSVRTEGRIGETDIDVSRGAVGRIDVRGGPTVRLALPEPVGVIAVRIDGAVRRCEVRTPADAPARISVRRGNRVVVDGEAQDGGRGPRTLSFGATAASPIVDFRADAVVSLLWSRSGNP
ncbi:hypothetical protein ACQP2F_14950 [Actinoplanes sp. CA-030573]|uniref:hypothetical protein n=1 Tax=Actinoplanes sp. CA-030573 TaxID=3239898 RepID=UPI003D8BF972